MLEVKNISLTLGGDKLFDNLSFSVSAGEMLCITGASGCGKTSLLRSIMGFIPVDRGFISIDGEQVTAESASVFRRQMSYLPQELSLPCSKVKDMVMLPLAIHANASADFSESRMMNEWHKLELQDDLLNKNVSEISGGQRQRMMIATTRMLNKNIMILDEPTSALDEHSTMIVADYIADAADHGTMVIAVSHDPLFVSRCTKKLQL